MGTDWGERGVMKIGSCTSASVSSVEVGSEAVLEPKMPLRQLEAVAGVPPSAEQMLPLLMKLFSVLVEELVLALTSLSGAQGALPATGGAPTSSLDGGFLWKPISDNDGRLVVLLPPAMTGYGAKVDVVSPDGDVLASGRFTSVANGGREHYRFDRSGGNFPDGSSVRISFPNGSTVNQTISETSRRFER